MNKQKYLNAIRVVKQRIFEQTSKRGHSVVKWFCPTNDTGKFLGTCISCGMAVRVEYRGFGEFTKHGEIFDTDCDNILV